LEIEEALGHCPTCSHLPSIAIADDSAVTDWEENSTQKMDEGDAPAPGPLTKTGKFKTVGSPSSIRWLKKRILFLRQLLSQDLTPVMLLAFLISMAAITGLGAAGLYAYSSLTLNVNLTDAVIEQYPNTKAIKIVQEFPSSTAGLSILQRIEQFAKEERLTSFHWWAAPDKTSGKYAVIFIYMKDRKEQTAVWLVDLENRRMKPDNTLAQSFTRL
jgi:hypothetical protein